MLPETTSVKCKTVSVILVAPLSFFIHMTNALEITLVDAAIRKNGFEETRSEGSIPSISNDVAE